MKNFLNADMGRREEFKVLLESFCRLVKKTDNVSLVPYLGESPLYFSRISEANQLEVLANFRRYFEVCLETLSQEPSLRNDKIFAWRMFQKMKVHPPSELMNQFRRGEIVEIYNDEFIQIFRNLRFFEICSYSLDELLCRPFWDLIARDQTITSMIVEQASTLLTGAVNGVFEFKIPRHVITEIASPKKNSVLLQQRLGAPLWGTQGKPEALIALLEVQEISATQL